MANFEELTPQALCGRCDPDGLPFETTAELEDLPGIIGQPRAVEAVRFGIGIEREGYNVFALGPAGMGKHSLLRQALAEQAATRPVPDDWCYVYNFAESHKPQVLRLPPGRGAELHRDMEEFIEDKGIPQNANLATYIVPTSKDVPDIKSIILESGSGKGPFGAKGIGEPTIAATAPAILNAIYDAVGVRITKLPVTPEIAFYHLKERDEGA